MSLEQQIEALNNTIQKLITTLEQSSVAPAEKPKKAAKAAEPVVEAVANEPEPQDVVVEAVPAPQPVVSEAPFTDANGLVSYVMASYKTLGPQKGLEIQGVLNSMGYANINDVKPEHYGQLYAGIEALK